MDHASFRVLSLFFVTFLPAMACGSQASPRAGVPEPVVEANAAFDSSPPSPSTPDFLGNDGGTPDASTRCNRLNIGILGNPGSNSSSNFQAWLAAAGTNVQRIQLAPRRRIFASDPRALRRHRARRPRS